MEKIKFRKYNAWQTARQKGPRAFWPKAQTLHPWLFATQNKKGEGNIPFTLL
jgi:hypothetical protein